VEYGDFGRYLSQQRELRGMTREELARVTKIPPTLLAALEEGQVERLPERIFVLHHVRAYARVLGLSEEDVLLRFEEVDGLPPEPPPAQLEQQRRKRAVATLALLTLLVAAAVVLLLVYGRAQAAGTP
jgi:cytoskeletal protein RodZ